jgi:hypothetical protein
MTRTATLAAILLSTLVLGGFATSDSGAELKKGETVEVALKKGGMDLKKGDEALALKKGGMDLKKGDEALALKKGGMDLKKGEEGALV